MEDLDLATLFGMADAIADHRDAEEKEAIERELQEAQSDLAEMIGYPELEE